MAKQTKPLNMKMIKRIGSNELPEDLRSPTDDEFKRNLSESLHKVNYAIQGARDGLLGTNNSEHITEPEANAVYDESRSKWKAAKT